VSETGSALEAAYRRTEYRVSLTDGRMLALRIGVRDRDAERRLRLAGVRKSWAIVTPCNPGSRRIGARCNATQLRRLERQLKRSGHRYLHAVNHDPSGRWPDEPGFLLCDPPRELAASLGRAFGQNAFVHGGIEAAPGLIWLV